jgi:hypothetical protein
MKNIRHTFCLSAAMAALCLNVHAAEPAKAPATPAAQPAAVVKPTLTLDQVPAAVRVAITREIGGTATDLKLDKKTKDGKTEFSFAGDLGKKNVKGTLKEDGSLIKKREKEELGAAGLPKPILKVAKRELKGAKILSASRSTKHTGEVSYSIKAETKDRTVDLSLDGDGTFDSKTEEKKKPEQKTLSLR